MCGICGVFGSTSAVMHTQVLKMADSLAHRGPDDHGVYLDELCALGHRRLSIIDLSLQGKQPMHNEFETVWTVVNGEIYNYKELRRDLETRGHRFYSNSDSEVVVHAYEEYGGHFLRVLHGMFALAVYDSKERKLILARDRVGKKPLYCAWDQQTLLFASEVKAIIAAGFHAPPNYSALPYWLQYQYLPGDETMFRGVW